MSNQEFWAKLRSGAYETKIRYAPFGAGERFDVYTADIERLTLEFKSDLFAHYGVTDHPNAERAWVLAWEHAPFSDTKGSRFTQVARFYGILVAEHRGLALSKQTQMTKYWDEVRRGTPEYEVRRKRREWEACVGRDMFKIMRKFCPNDVTALRVYELFQEQVWQIALREYPSSIMSYGNPPTKYINRVFERQIQHRLGAQNNRAGWVRNKVREIEAAEDAAPLVLSK